MPYPPDLGDPLTAADRVWIAVCAVLVGFGFATMLWQGLKFLYRLIG